MRFFMLSEQPLQRRVSNRFWPYFIAFECRTPRTGRGFLSGLFVRPSGRNQRHLLCRQVLHLQPENSCPVALRLPGLREITSQAVV